MKSLACVLPHSAYTARYINGPPIEVRDDLSSHIQLKNFSHPLIATESVGLSSGEQNDYTASMVLDIEGCVLTCALSAAMYTDAIHSGATS